MTSFGLGRYTLGTVAVVALLAGCGVDRLRMTCGPQFFARRLRDFAGPSSRPVVVALTLRQGCATTPIASS
jgi:hypothetical protein